MALRSSPLNVAAGFALEGSTVPTPPSTTTYPPQALVAGLDSSRAWACCCMGDFLILHAFPIPSAKLLMSRRLDDLTFFCLWLPVLSSHLCIRWLSLPLLLVQISVSPFYLLPSWASGPTNSFHLTRGPFLLSKIQHFHDTNNIPYGLHDLTTSPT